MAKKNDARTIRRSITFTHKAVGRLERLREETDALNDTEVVRNALALYDWVIEQKRGGKDFYLRDGNGAEREVPLFEIA